MKKTYLMLAATAMALSACGGTTSTPPAPAPTAPQPASADCEPVVHPSTGETLGMEIVVRDASGNVLSRRPLGTDEECP